MMDTLWRWLGHAFIFSIVAGFWAIEHYWVFLVALALSVVVFFAGYHKAAALIGIPSALVALLGLGVAWLYSHGPH